MKSGNESNTVIDLLEKTAEMPPNPDFSNWLHQEGPKTEFITMLRLMGSQPVTPGMLRYCFQYAYQAGFRDGAANV
jgi:hypothetical protein